ncbi:MAG: L-serine ammonia-lyase, iron-sulfur-dependent, subunit alpha, partial [Spirochaetaceae bacterium]|nr:L-serine ammonia-lyase, iron-sulfur-dependent, subunit alpha [Spirochaetaceae bacterium]
MFESLESIIVQCKKEKKNFSQIVIENELKATDNPEEKIIAKMQRMWDVMLEASNSYDGSRFSNSGFSGGDGKLFSEYAAGGNTLSGDYISSVISEALKMAESNA